MTVHVDPSTTTDLSNTASVTASTPDPDLTNDAWTEPTTVVPVVTSADLSITKADDVDPVTPGTDLTYTLVVMNNGPSGATGVAITDPLPAGTSFVSADGGGLEAGGTVTWAVGALANGATSTVHVTVHVDPSRSTPLSNTASVAGAQPDPISSNDSATEPTAVNSVVATADLRITKTAAASIPLGSNLVYTITVTNGGPSDATGVVVQDPLPAGATFVSATPTQGTCSEVSGVVTCALGAFAKGSTATVVLTVTPTTVGDLVNTANVTSSTLDPVIANNTASATTVVVAGATSADLSITKTASPGQVSVGHEVTYTMTVTNLGPDAADGVTVTDPLDARLAFVSATTVGPSPAGSSRGTWATSTTGDRSC